MEKQYHILAINPGSTSTKIAVFRNEQEILRKTMDHAPSELPGTKVQEQLDFRREAVLQMLKEADIAVEDMDIFVGRGGGLVNTKGGVYEINEKLLEHARIGIMGQHPAQLASQICAQFREAYGGWAFVVNPPDVDEFIDVARMTGIRNVYRNSQVHALNQKEVALRCCREEGYDYQKVNLIVAHIGGGISVAAHRRGRMIDSNNILQGDGPMAPTRCGSVPVRQIVELCFDGRCSKEELLDKTSRSGGLMDLLGTADVCRIEERIQKGDTFAKTVYDTMIYQIAKAAGSCAAALEGEVQRIVLTGGIARSEYLVTSLKSRLEWIAPLRVYAGEYEMEALVHGALRAVCGEEPIIRYAGVPVWTPHMLKETEEMWSDTIERR